MCKKKTEIIISPIDLIVAGIDHLNSAFHLYNLSPRNYDSAGYLTQLGLELVFKAIISFNKKSIPLVHDLNKLHKKKYLGTFHPLYTSNHARELIKHFNKFYYLRYPNRNNPVSIGSEDAEKLLELLEILKDSIPLDLKEQYWKQSLTEKSGRILMAREKK